LKYIDLNIDYFGLYYLFQPSSSSFKKYEILTFFFVILITMLLIKYLNYNFSYLIKIVYKR